MPKIPKVGTLVEVLWHDSHSSNGWLHPDDCEEACVPMDCKTTGRIIADKNNYIGIAGSISLDGNGDICWCTNRMFIPKGIIRKITKLRG